MCPLAVTPSPWLPCSSAGLCGAGGRGKDLGARGRKAPSFSFALINVVTQFIGSGGVMVVRF